MNVASSSPLFIAYLESIVRAIEQSRVHNSETDELTQQQLQDLNVAQTAATNIKKRGDLVGS